MFFLFNQNKIHTAGKKLLTMLIVGGLLTSPFNTFAEDYTSDIESSKSELSQLSERASAISQLLSEKQDELSAISAEIAQLESDRISKMTQEEMAVSELEFLKESIETFEKDIAVMEEEYGKLESLFMERAKVMYQNSDRDLFTIFFESDNIFDFLDKIEVYTKMIKQDKALMEDLKSSRQQLELKKQQQEQLFSNKEVLLAEIESAITELKNKQTLKAGDYTELSSLLSTIAAEEETLNGEIDQLAAKINALEAKQKEAEERARKAEEELKRKEEEARKAAEEERKKKEAEAEAARLEAEKAKDEAEKLKQETDDAKNQANQDSLISRGENDTNFCWPIEHYYYISSPFGYRVHPITGKWALHTGVDLAAAGGTKIYAAQSGVVTVSTTNGGSYGYYVRIQHQSGLDTLYAHCSKLLVSEGQYVTRGQVIALVGKTGAATGNHLHFEVIINGTPVQPLNYISEP